MSLVPYSLLSNPSNLYALPYRNISLNSINLTIKQKPKERGNTQNNEGNTQHDEENTQHDEGNSQNSGGNSQNSGGNSQNSGGNTQHDDENTQHDEESPQAVEAVQAGRPSASAIATVVWEGGILLAWFSLVMMEQGKILQLLNLPSNPTHAPTPPCIHVLELGCGTGVASVAVAAGAARYWAGCSVSICASDVSTGALDLARENLRQVELPSGMESWCRRIDWRHRDSLPPSTWLAQRRIVMLAESVYLRDVLDDLLATLEAIRRAATQPVLLLLGNRLRLGLEPGFLAALQARYPITQVPPSEYPGEFANRTDFVVCTAWLE